MRFDRHGKEVDGIAQVNRDAISGLRALVAGAALILPLAACGDDGLAGGLRRSGVVGQPDEFMVLPTRPLEMPSDLAALPPPTPGASNRVDRQPRAETITALTGQPPAAAPGAPALAAAAGSANPDIRATLTAEDDVYARENQPRLLERWFGGDRNRQVYEDMTLDAESEYDRLRASGARVPEAPPRTE